MTIPQTPSREPVLTITDLSVTFATGRGEVAAVRNVSLEVAAGETVADCGTDGTAAEQESAADESARGFDCLFHICCGHLALTFSFCMNAG